MFGSKYELVNRLEGTDQWRQRLAIVNVIRPALKRLLPTRFSYGNLVDAGRIKAAVTIKGSCRAWRSEGVSQFGKAVAFVARFRFGRREETYLPHLRISERQRCPDLFQSVRIRTGGVVGKMVFGGVLAIELFMVCFIAPAFTTGAISGEKERQTFDLLRTTLLPARRIVIGKLIAALAYIVLLLVVAALLGLFAYWLRAVRWQLIADRRRCRCRPPTAAVTVR